VAVTWWKGLILGFSIAAPLGPIGLLCIKRTLEGGRWRGILSGLGAASADAIYGSLAAFGLATLLEHYTWFHTWMQVLGGGFIIYLGTRFAISKTAVKENGSEPAKAGSGKVYLTTFLLTLSNPVTIFAFLGMFAGAGVSNGSSAFFLVLGIFSGSMAWWITLAMLTHWLGKRLNGTVLSWVNRLAGVALVGFGIWSVASAVIYLIK